MSQISCQQLREWLENIKNLKIIFEDSVKQIKGSADIPIATDKKNLLQKELLAFKKELLGNPEMLVQLEHQYYESINVGAAWNLYNKENPLIKGIDGEIYPIPTWDEILFTLTPEHLRNIKKFKKGSLLVVPFALPMKIFLEKINTKLIQSNADIIKGLDEYDDESDNLRYFNSFLVMTRGFSKTQILKKQEAYNRFPGWQVMFMENDEGFITESRDKGPENFLSKLDRELDVSNVEEWLFSGMMVNFQNFFERPGKWFNSYLSSQQKIYVLRKGLKFGKFLKWLKPKNCSCRVVFRIR